MAVRADNYKRRIFRGVQRYGLGLTLTGGTGGTIMAIVLPAVVQVVSSSATPLQVRQSSAVAGSYSASDTPPPSSGSTAGTSSSTAYPTIYLLQSASATDVVPTVGQTFPFDGVTWTVQSVAFEYIQGQRLAIVTTATGPAVA